MATSSISLKKLQTRRDAHVHDLFVALTRLGQIVTAHGSTLCKRWKKRTAEQRRSLLKRVLPEIPTPHRPDVHYYRNVKGLYRINERSKEMALMLPELNLEDLSKPRPFLDFVNSRACNSPALFMLQDLT